jgi:hypothetical protein
VDRLDNYREHVRRHSENRKGSRTKYFPEAIDEVDSWKKRGKDNKLGVPADMHPAYSRRAKASMFKSKL